VHLSLLLSRLAGELGPVAISCEGKGLLDLLAATLNQNDQQNDSNNGGYNPNNRYIVHVSSPFLLIKELVK
jgi:hypothetical protein